MISKMIASEHLVSTLRVAFVVAVVAAAVPIVAVAVPLLWGRERLRPRRVQHVAVAPQHGEHPLRSQSVSQSVNRQSISQSVRPVVGKRHEIDAVGELSTRAAVSSDQSNAGSAGIFSRQTNQTQEAQ
eukprot:1178966-Prorocentrum_minimum.AAC.2